jgi:hypothetical protein
MKESFELSFQNLVEGAKFLPPLLEDRSIPSSVSLRNLRYLVVPRATRYLDYFSKPIFKSSLPSGNLIITLQDFNTYDIVNVNKAHINIFSAVKMVLSMELFLDEGSRLVGSLKFPTVDGTIPDYQFLTEVLPFDFGNKVDDRFLSVYGSSHSVILTSSVILTFLYTMYNLDNGVKVVSNSDGNDKAIDYINKVRDRLEIIGKNFIEAIENLGILNAVLL